MINYVVFIRGKKKTANKKSGFNDRKCGFNDNECGSNDRKCGFNFHYI